MYSMPSSGRPQRQRPPAGLRRRVRYRVGYVCGYAEIDLVHTCLPTLLLYCGNDLRDCVRISASAAEPSQPCST